MAGFVGREALGQKKLNQAEMDAPEWGGKVLVRELDCDEIVNVRSLAAGSVQGGEPSVVSIGIFERNLVEKGWIDGDGNRVLADGEGELLRKESAKLINRMAEKISELSGLKPDAVAIAKKN